MRIHSFVSDHKSYAGGCQKEVAICKDKDVEAALACVSKQTIINHTMLEQRQDRAQALERVTVSRLFLATL